jgi:hypothetical protein
MITCGYDAMMVNCAAKQDRHGVCFSRELDFSTRSDDSLLQSPGNCPFDIDNQPVGDVSSHVQAPLPFHAHDSWTKG